MLTARSKRWYGGDVAVIDNSGTRPLVLRHSHLPFYGGGVDSWDTSGHDGEAMDLAA